MKDEYDLFKESSVPPSYIEAHVALLHFINRAWEDNVYINSRISIFAGKSNMYLNVADRLFPMTSHSNMEQFIAGQHELNDYKGDYDAEGKIKREVIQPIGVSNEAFEDLLRQCKLGCEKISPLLYLFAKYADEFHAVEVRSGERARLTCFAKLKDVWFSNIGNPWSYKL